MNINDLGRVADGEQALVSDQAATRLDPSGFDPSRKVRQSDREWCIRFDKSTPEKFLDGWYDDSSTMSKVLAHRVAVEADAARRIFGEVERDLGIETNAAIRVYAAIKRAIAQGMETRRAETPAAPSQSDDSPVTKSCA